MLSLRELRRAARVLDERMTGHRIEGIVQTDAHAVVFTLYGRDADSAEGAKLHLLVSCAPGTGRVSLLAQKVKAPETPLPFARFLRARLPGARLTGAALRGDDRQLVLSFESREGAFALLLALDDATGRVPYGVFRGREDTQGYVELLKGIITRSGIPLGV